MKVISTEQIIRHHIEYDNSTSKGREDVITWLNETYGEFNWRSVRQGPKGDGSSTGLYIIEVDPVGETT